MIKRISILAAAFVPAIGAQAADVVYTPPVVEDVVIVEQPGFTWTGFYLGAAFGYHWTQANANTYRLVDNSFDFDNWVGGAFFGYNYQLSNDVVVGVEGEVDYFGNSDDQSVQVIISGAPEPAVGKFERGWAGSLRGRLGYAMDRTLIYATAGGEVASGKVVGSTALYSLDTGEQAILGWTIGAGIEHAFNDNLFGRIEYRYSDFPKYDKSFSWDPNFSMDASQSVVKVGLGYKF
ncbi:outer membrane protein [Martelella mediterranea]|uniref:Opacity protein antigen n=1 Tax=Martelella mediterranea DSM 17316 TaxID=1122214 RepID=A0A1U9Z2S9_9HYPH|nr:outer membrane protein [Martelella mediterranea]AQZ51978.1 Opacity protein antigen [Martelella mediterranea DSM 17316]